MWKRITKLQKSLGAAICVSVAVTLSSGFSPAAASGIESSPGPVAYLNPTTIAACNVGLGETVISTYAAQTLGNIDLKCGDSSSGYVHIRERHQNDWQQVVDLAGGGGNWDDLMEFVTKQSIEAPSAGYPVSIGSGKICYSTPALIINDAGATVRVLTATVVVSSNNRKVITSIPTTGSPSCNSD